MSHLLRCTIFTLPVHRSNVSGEMSMAPLLEFNPSTTELKLRKGAQRPSSHVVPRSRHLGKIFSIFALIVLDSSCL